MRVREARDKILFIFFHEHIHFLSDCYDKQKTKLNKIKNET